VVFHQLRHGGCLSYLIGCEETCAAALVDPEASLVDKYLALAARDGLRLHYLIDTHTHADHFSASRRLSEQLGVLAVMHRASPAPFVDMHVDDGELVALGTLRLAVMHTPGHTRDSIVLRVGDRLLTGDTLLIGATGRTDLPTGDPDALYDSLFDGVLKLPPDLKVFPAHDYKGREVSTLAREIAENPRLKFRDRTQFVEQMRTLDLQAPTHLTEALRTNMTGGLTVQALIEAARKKVPFMAMDEVSRRLEASGGSMVLLDVREREAFDAGHLPGAINLPRGQLELRVNQLLRDPLQRIVVYCELGIISTLAAATLKDMGFDRVVALDGGMKAWSSAGFPVARE
jgi:glyoxylase-like metal-dependent hydrolase (beta-lactamase superfamily II)